MHLCRARSVALAGLFSVLIGSYAQAELLGVNSVITANKPLLTFIKGPDGAQTISYDPATNTFTMVADLFTVQLPAGSTLLSAEPDSVQVSIVINLSGEASPNGITDDLIVEGNLNVDGVPGYEYSGILLTGKLIAFGSLNNPGVGSEDQYDFIFEPTGGQLASFWSGGNIGMFVQSERSTWNGTFDVEFSGEAKGNIGLIPCEKQSVRGRVFCDRNGTIIPHEGLTVTAYNSENQPVGWATTDDDGFYLIPGLGIGDYTIAIVPPADTTTCSPAAVSVHVSCEEGATANFCLCPCIPTNITGKVVCDVSGQQVPQVGVTVTAFDINDEPAGSAQTDDNGEYTITGLAAGTYRVLISPLPNTKPCDAGEAILTLVCNEDGVANFCLCPCPASNLSGKIICDRNGSVTPVADVSITITDPEGTVVGQLTSGPDGTYSIDLNPGSYTVAITPPANTTACDEISKDVIIECDVNSQADFCVCPCLPSEITGRVICEKGGTSAPIEGVTVRVLSSNNQEVASTTTEADGSYNIPGLNPGTYTVEVVAPAGTRACGEAARVVTLECEKDGTADFCLCPCEPSSISGKVICPTDANSPIPGVEITVYTFDNTVAGSATTEDDGTYIISGLQPGTYSVVITPVDGTKLCGPSSQTVTLECEQDGTADFCLCPCEPSNIRGRVVCIRYGTTGAIPGATVKVFDVNNQEVDTTISEVDGSYVFEELQPGTYTVQVTPPGDYASCGTTSQTVTLLCEQDAVVPDFCFCPPLIVCEPKIVGKVKCPNNQQPIPGITIKAYNKNNQVIGQAVTVADGSYSIKLTQTGQVTVKMIVPSGYGPCGDTSVCLKLSCDDKKTINFCLCPPCVPGSVKGQVKCSSTGSPIGGVTVKAYQGSKVKGSAVTGSDGKYTIANLAPGSYTIKLSVPSGYRSCASTSACVKVGCGSTKTINFCVCPPCSGTISGKVKCTSTGNYLSGITVKAYLNGKEKGSAVTDSSGKYTISNLPEGSYTVKLTVPGGYSSCGQTSACVSVRCGKSNTVDFCLCPPCSGAKVTGTVKCPSTGQNLSGVTVKVYDGAKLKGSATTGSDGKYTISNVPAGKYTVQVIVTGGYKACGSTSECITLSCGQTKSIDFCLCPPCANGKITGVVKCSSNGKKISGVKVRVYNSSNQEKGSAVTDSNGKYTISNLGAGSYTVKMEVPSGYEACGGTSSSVTVNCGQTKTVDFCLCPKVCKASTVSGVVKCDKTGKPVSGVVIKAYDAKNTQVGSDTTSSDGKYSINLSEGTYTLKLTLPQGTEGCKETTVCVTLSCGQCKTVNFCVCPTQSKPSGCTRSPGYWKNHTDKWPVKSLQVGSVTYNQTQLLNLLNDKTPSGSKSNAMTVKLAKFVVAAQFSVLSGAPTADILPVITQANHFLASYPPGTTPPSNKCSSGESLKDKLDYYVNKYECK